MSRIMEAWDEVLRNAVSGDYDEQQLALLQIGFVLQRHNPHITIDSDAPEEVLSRELLRLTLDEKRQADTVEYLIALVRKHPQEADSFLYALSNAQPKILIEPLLKLLLENGAKLKSDAIYQALIALDGILRHVDATVKSNLDTYDIIPLLDDWSESNDTLIANKADILADKIIGLLEENE